MFKQTKTTLKELTAQYRSVLKKCALLNVIAVAGITFGANADYIGGQYINEDTILENEIVADQAFTIEDNAIARTGIENPNNEFGGYAFVNRPSLLTVENSSFSNISFDGYGAVFSTRVPKGGDVAKIIVQDSIFSSNHAIEDGGAIANYGHLTISGSTFEKNTSFLKGENYKQQVIVGTDVPDDGVMGGGALALGSQSVSLATSIASSQFNKNESGLNGGAIATRLGKDGDNHAATLDIEAAFFGNKAYNDGGAIYNTFYANNGLGKGDGVTVKGTFTSNTAKNGGAVYNDGAKDNAGNFGGVMTVKNSTFTDNTAGNGGAFYNTGTLTIADAMFDANNATTGNGGAIYVEAKKGTTETSINGSTFTNNTAVSDGGCGGAIALLTGTVNIDNSVFEGNQAQYYGAIYAKGGGVSQDNTVNISNSMFKNNSALGVGAVGLLRKGKIDNVVFENNKATADVDGAGALFVGAVSELTLSNSMFKGNTSATRGGAISTRSGDIGNNKDAKLDITNIIFDSNIAETTGGAFDNWLYGSKTEPSKVYIGNSIFTNNQANDGAVIYNHGAGDQNDKTALIKIAESTFKDNTAINKAGAIYNENGATIIFAGKNTFSGNKANGVLNDIYNDGELNISGSLNLDGGITGNGIINFTGDTDLVARLQKDNAAISGKTISGLENVTITGLVVENGLADAEYSLASADTVQMQFSDITATNALYDFARGTTNGSVKLTRKSVAEQTAGLEKAGLDSSAAKTIAAISGVTTTGNATTDALFADLTAAAQSGDAGAAEVINEVAKAINPESESVVQSAAVSAQNMINDLTVERMDLGRNGGDVDLTSGGVWVQGLYNKSKNADKFSGHTRGIAAGIDETINKDIMLGIGYAFGRSDITAQTRDTDIDSHSVFLYGQYKPSEWYANATLNYTISKYKEDGVTIVPVNAKYHANTFGANVATGYDFVSGITPELGLRYLHVRTNDYTNSLGMDVDANSTDFLTGILGARYGFDIAASDAFLIRPELSAAAKYDMLSDENTATVALPGVNAYTLDGERLNRFGGEFGAGLTMSYYGFDLQLLYSIDVRKDYTSQTGMVKFRYNF